ncbi:MAG: ribonuclease HI [Clostridiales bacterium]|nr:ribonuclease HI [Clostridiales bacterium]
MTVLRIYTDGGCSGNQSDENIGGWGAILEFGENKKELRGGELNTTNNRMEMTALLEAFKALKKEGLEIEIFSDSSYLMNCFREKWYETWRRNGWKNSQKKPVENRELWEALLSETEKHRSLKFYRVKGHVNLNSKSTNFDALYEKFLEWNGASFTFEDFKYITMMNNRADELCNISIDELR